MLGLIRDVPSVENLGDLLYDDTTLVAQAAATSLVRIGREHLETKGDVARLLVDALDTAKGPRRRDLLGGLVRLSERDLGEDVDPWREWAYRMP